MFVKLIEMCARRMIQQNEEFERSCFCAEKKVENLDDKHTHIHTPDHAQ